MKITECAFDVILRTFRSLGCKCELDYDYDYFGVYEKFEASFFFAGEYYTITSSPSYDYVGVFVQTARYTPNKDYSIKKDEFIDKDFSVKLVLDKFKELEDRRIFNEL